jgi:hypothetical protein
VRILITGSRTWTDVSCIIEAITDVVRESGVSKEDTVIVHGACPRGADAIADALAKQWGVAVERHPADWSIGRRAGFVRNAEMANLGADVCLAFNHNNSNGTKMMADLTQKAGIETRIYRR